MDCARVVRGQLAGDDRLQRCRLVERLKKAYDDSAGLKPGKVVRLRTVHARQDVCFGQQVSAPHQAGAGCLVICVRKSSTNARAGLKSNFHAGGNQLLH
jgi:hypothetical protein